VRATPAQEAILAKVNGTLEDKRGLVEKFRDYLSDLRSYVALELKQKLLDQFAAIKRLERATFGAGANLDASVSAYKAARLSKNLPSVMDYLMNHGQLAYRNGSFAMKQGGKGLLQVFKPLIDAGTLRLWEGYATAYRAQRLLAEGKETNFGRTFDPATGEWSWSAADAQREINELLALGQQYPDFEAVRQEYVSFQTSVLDVAESAGLINAEQRATWEKSDYVPFYRIAEAVDGAKGPRKRRGIANQTSGIRKLKGGAAPVAIMENIVRNIESLVDASFKNVAMQRVADLASGNNDLLVRIPYKAMPFKASVSEVLDTLEKAGVDTSGLTTDEAAEFVKFWRMRAPKGKDVVSVMVDGKPIFYRVKDAPLLRSVQSMGPRVHSWWMNALMMPKNVLTNLVTLDPAFMAANTIRDSFSAWVIADTPIKPGIDTAKGFVRSLRNDKSKLAVMAAGGGSGHYNNLREGRVRDYIRQLTPAARKTFLESIVDTPKKLGRLYADLGRATENANRLAIADSVKKRGGTDAEAAFQALDIMDFGLRGDSTLLNFFLDTVPFLNARIQGLYRLGRGLKENPKRVATHGAIIMGATAALLAANWDDERYWELPEWERDIYYHFWLGDRHIRIPKPFEVGQIFSTIPERLFEYVGKTGDAKLLGRRMLTMIRDTFAMNPLPQAARPLAERAMNLNTFTGRPIISRGDEFKQPENQFNVMTSETLREVADAMPDSAPEWLRSPKTLEHFVRGYFGSLGMYALTAADALTRAATDAPEEPAMTPGDFWVMKRFAPSSDLRQTKYVEQFYELHREIEGVVREIKELQAEDPAQARALATENADLLRFAPRTQSSYKLLQNLRKQEQRVYESAMPPDRKRAELAAIADRRNQAARNTVLVAPRRPSPIFNPFARR
jgi:CHASE3 domain sensor protein